MPLLGEVEQAEEGRGDAEGFVSTEQNASQSVCKYDYRGDLDDRGDHGDQRSLIMVIVVILILDDPNDS